METRSADPVSRALSDMSRADYLVYSDTLTLAPNRSLRPGSRTAQPDIRAPGRRVHAAERGAPEALCGVATEGLFTFPDQAFGKTTRKIQCPVCRGIYDQLSDAD